MPEVKLNLPIHMKVDISTKDLREYLLSTKRMKPCMMAIGAKHAEWLEFGSSPAQKSSDGELQRNIELWLRRKKGITNKKELARMTKEISAKIARHGIKARPFWRPAFFMTVENLQQLFDRGWSLYDIAVHMQQVTDQNIMHNENAPYVDAQYMPYNGTLQESMYVRYLTEEEARDALIEKADVRQIANDVWETKTRQQGKTLK